MVEQQTPQPPRRSYYRRRRVEFPHAFVPRLDPNAQYLGTHAARAAAFNVGWSRSATIIIALISLLATVFAFILGTDPPYKAFRLMIVSCLAGMITSLAWIRIANRTGEWVAFDNSKLAELERVGRALVQIFNSPEFERIARGVGAGIILKLFSRGSLFLWIGILLYIVNSQYPDILWQALQDVGNPLKQLWQTRWIDGLRR